jgi:hypothetical protein
LAVLIFEVEIAANLFRLDPLPAACKAGFLFGASIGQAASSCELERLAPPIFERAHSSRASGV